MTTSSTPLLGLALPVTGELSGTWGDTVNNSLTSLLDSAVAGYTTVSVTTANQAFTHTALVANEARSAIIRLTTTTTANFAVYAPPTSKVYLIWNNSGYTATIYNSTVAGNTTAAGAGITIANGDKVLVFTNGTDFYDVKANSITGILPVVNGGTGAATLTGLVVGNGTSPMTAVTAPTGGVVGTTDTQTLTNKRMTQRIGTVASGSTITPTGDASDQYNVTALAVPATIAAPSGTPTDGQKLVLRIKDNGTARALTWTTTSGAYRAVGVTLPTTTVLSKVLYIGCIYNSADVYWDVVAVVQQA